jgi:hypothetical protein
MPGGLSLKLVAVLAAFAFVIGFRVQAGHDDSPARAATTLSPSGATALASDTTVQEAPRGIAAPAFARVPALPALHRAPARPKPAKKAPPVTSAAPVATAVPTAVPSTPVVTTKPATPKKKSYVGTTFDTKG